MPGAIHLDGSATGQNQGTQPHTSWGSGNPWNGTVLLKLLDLTAAGSSHGSMGIAISDPSTSRTTTGWSASVSQSAKFSEMTYAATASTWGATTLPSGAPASNDCWRTQLPMTGTFAAGTWTIAIALQPTVSITATVNVQCRIWHSPDPTGLTNATEITSGAVSLGNATWTSASTQQNTTLTTGSLAAAILNNEYVFLQLALKDNATGTFASGIFVVVGVNSRVTTPVFSCAPASSRCSVAFFWRITAANNFNNIFQMDKGDNVNKGWELAFDSLTTRMQFLENGSSVLVDNICAPATVGQWYFVAASINSAGLVLVGWKQAGAIGIKSGTATMTMAQYTPVGLNWGSEAAGVDCLADIAGLKVWNGTLSLAEMELESRQMYPVRVADLWGFYPGTRDTDFLSKVSGAPPLMAWADTASHLTAVAGPPVPDYVQPLWGQGPVRANLTGISNSAELGK